MHCFYNPTLHPLSKPVISTFIPLQTNLVTARIFIAYTFCSLGRHTFSNLEKKNAYKFRYKEKHN